MYKFHVIYLWIIVTPCIALHTNPLLQNESMVPKFLYDGIHKIEALNIRGRSRCFFSETISLLVFRATRTHKNYVLLCVYFSIISKDAAADRLVSTVEK